ncbi:MAG TPA: hypothetical protein VFM02_01155 [Candidatus Paceibacterota bacterium]|nr:hypothetical protein [Candidatus Paceibacterota bacterium]
MTKKSMTLEEACEKILQALQRGNKDDGFLLTRHDSIAPELARYFVFVINRALPPPRTFDLWYREGTTFGEAARQMLRAGVVDVFCDHNKKHQKAYSCLQG